ncbi:MAG: hypothetical protein K8T10_05210 [Candidatus Eremiobacteraeota bacterium]|nr:hypothetical protein [Candidatus Eremiobacteraeota bacterium]
MKKDKLKQNMTIGILSKSPDIYFNLRIKEESQKKGIECKVMHPSDFLLYPDNILLEDESLTDFSCVILRSPPYREEKEFFHHAARILESRDVWVINSPSAVEIVGNKMLTKLKLVKKGIPVLKSVAVRKACNLDGAVSHVGGFPVFLKTFYGTRGIGVIFCPCRETLYAAAQTMWAYYTNIFIEEYAEKSKGETVRVLVCADEVIGAVMNKPAKFPFKVRKDIHNNEEKEFAEKSKNNPVSTDNLIRSNYSRGGDTNEFLLSVEMEKMALSACRATGIFLAGVDLIETDKGWAVLEINSSPGIKGFESTLKINAAAQIIDRMLLEGI